MHVNNDFQKNSNISQVFETLWKNQDFSRIDISKKLGIYRSTVSNIIDNMLESNLIYEGERGSATEKGGRKPICLSINKDFGKIAGIEIQEDFYRLVVMDFCGNILFEKKDKHSLGFDDTYPQLAFIRVLDGIVNPLVKDFPDLKGICVGIPGIVDTKHGIVTKSVPFKLENWNFAREVFLRYKIPLLVENDAKCCAWLHGGQRDEEDNFLCVMTRNHETTGIAVGLSMVMNGKILYGNNYAAGEYVSLSWKAGRSEQTGLPEAVVKTINQVDDSYKEWTKDLFSTLTVMVPLLVPGKIYLHGQSESRRELIEETIQNEVPQFVSVTKQFNSEFVIIDEDPYEIAKGSALMFIQLLFQMPFLEDHYYYSKLNWEALSQAAKGKNND